MTIRSRLLLALPLLLLLPLGALKWRKEWRQEHPPLSSTDRKLRALLAGASRVAIGGTGPLWRRLTGLPESSVSFVELKGHAQCSRLAEVLRTREPEEGAFPGDYTHSLVLLIASQDRKDFVTRFNYVQDSGGSYLQPCTPGESSVRVYPRFVPRFEALVTSLAQEIKRKRAHRKSARTPTP